MTRMLPLRHEEHFFKQKYQPQGRNGPSMDIWKRSKYG